VNDIYRKIKSLILAGDVRISSHGYDELSEDKISVRDIVERIANSQVIEEYLDYPKGPCVLVLQHDKNANPVHVVWGIPKGLESPAVLVTAYRPDPDRWSEDNLRRKK
jgi:hypothetical protein